MKDTISFPAQEFANNLKRFAAGEAVFSKDDPGGCMYFIVSGAVDIKVEGRFVDNLQSGQLFGEMALIDKRARSADAIARVDSEIALVDEQQFLAITRSNPEFALEVMRLIIDRLRNRMADLQEVRTYLGLLQG